MPAMVAPDAHLKEIAKDLHESIGAAFYIVIRPHAMAALCHHDMLRDNTLRRMWRGK